MHVEGMCKLSYRFVAPPRAKLSLSDSACFRAARRVDEVTNDAGSLSPSARAMFAMIALAAEADEPCPPNRAIAGTLGLSSVGHVPALLNHIQAAGLIRIERGLSSRIVTILASGERTAGEPGRIHRRHRFEREERRHINPGDERPRKRADRAAATGAPSRSIARDPCFHCGVRADIGCAHRPRARERSLSGRATPASRTPGGKCEIGGN